MYGLPPPAKVPPQPIPIGPDGKPVTFVEVANRLNFEEDELVVGEGVYKLLDDLHIATPPPHPSETPVFNPNPLATNPSPPTSGTRIHVCQTSAKAQLRPQPSRLASAFKPGLQVDKGTEKEREPRLSEDTGTGTGTGTSESGSHPYSNGRSPGYGAGNAALAPAASRERDKDKRKKPKTGLGKTSSSFISRYMQKEDLIKKAENRSGDCLMLFANINRSFCWLDVTESVEDKKQNLAKLMFARAHPLCHDLNETTKSSFHMDVVIGTNLSDILWYEPISQRYSRINKNGAISPNPVTQIKWIPGSDNLFLAAHTDGTLIVYDKERDDAAFEPENDGDDYALETPADEKLNTDFGDWTGETPLGPGQLHVHKSVNSKNQKNNPVASYQVSNQRINNFAFSPDSRHLAVVSEDGSLSIIDYLTETLLDLYSSYYDGFTCVCWSPDGRYVVTGGKDDLVTIWSLQDRCIIARCIGHKSWVSAVAFDPWRCDGRDYRFGSVGEDQRLMLWDFGPGMLHAPKGARRGHKGSVVSLTAGGVARARNESLASLRLRSTTSLNTEETGDDFEAREFLEHPVESRKVVPELPPVLNKVLDDGPLSHLLFREDCIMTAATSGHVRTFMRPVSKEKADEVHQPDTPGVKEESHPHVRSDITVPA